MPKPPAATQGAAERNNPSKVIVPPTTASTPQIHFAINRHGKDKQWDYELLASKYEDRTGTLQDVVDHIKQGHAVCAGLLGGQRRMKANVIGSQWILLDIDNSSTLLDETGKPVKGADGKAVKIYEPQLTLEQASEHPFIKAHCALIYTSASHKPDWHKFRLVFLLPQFESDIATIEAMIGFLMQQLPHDPACKDASRVFYGNTNAEIPLFNPDAFLPLEWREQAIAQAQERVAKREEQQKQREIRQAEYQSQPGDTDALILDALRYIPPREPGSGNYEQSITVLMALHSHFGDAEAERIAEQWSPSIPGDTWNIGKKIRSFKRTGVTIGSLFHIAEQYGWKFPQREQSYPEPTISRDEWEWKFGIPRWFKDKLAQTCSIFKGFGKAPKTPKPPTAKPKEPKTSPKTIKYVPGQLPTPEQYKAMGSPKILFEKGQRNQANAELIGLGYRHILDSSGTGSGKSFEVGLGEPERFDVDRLWYFSTEHRNPSVSSVEANYTDMPVRNDGMKIDYSRKTALNKPHVRHPREDEKADTEGNCYRAPIFRKLAEKGYGQVSQEAETNPICASCPVAARCSGHPDASPPGPGYSFRNDRREAFTSDRIRASANSAPAAKDLVVKTNDAGEKTISNRNGAFWDEASRQIQPYETVTAQLADCDETWAEFEHEMPLIYDQFRPLRLALRPLIAKQYKPTQENYHGFNDAQLREIIGEPPEDITGIINVIKALQPNLEEAIKEFHFTKDVRISSNWLTPFLEVWAGIRRGTLRINNGILTITTHNTRHAEIAKAMQFNVYLDATANKSWLALSLGIDESDIVHIQQDCGDFRNLSIVQVEGLGLAGRSRSKTLETRIAAIKTTLTELHPDIAFIDHKAHADVGVGNGWWFNHNRGSNEFQKRSALASIGAPYKNIGSLQDIYITLTGDRNVDKDAPGFSQFVDHVVQAEISQCVGRLRANLRPEESLTYYSCADYDLGFLEEYYPSATIKRISAFELTPEAGTKTEQCDHHFKNSILDYLVQMGEGCFEALEELTQTKAAELLGLTQGRVSQYAKEVFGSWRGFKKILATLIESLYRTANNSDPPLDDPSPPLDEDGEFLAQTYFPMAMEEGFSDRLTAISSTLQAYGWQGFQEILAALKPEVRGRMLGTLVSCLPVELQEEFKAIATELRDISDSFFTNTEDNSWEKPNADGA